MNFFSTLMDNAAHAIHSTDPAYIAYGKALNTFAYGTMIAAAVAGVASVVFAAEALGAGNFGGLALACIKGFVAYNIFTIGCNVAKISRNVASYMAAYGANFGLDKDRVNATLVANTIGCHFVINEVVEKLDSIIKNKQFKRFFS